MTSLTDDISIFLYLHQKVQARDKIKSQNFVNAWNDSIFLHWKAPKNVAKWEKKILSFCKCKSKLNGGPTVKQYYFPYENKEKFQRQVCRRKNAFTVQIKAINLGSHHENTLSKVSKAASKLNHCRLNKHAELNQSK